LTGRHACETQNKTASALILKKIAGQETRTHGRVGGCEKDSETVLGVWLSAPLPTPRALPDRGALWPLAVGVEKDLGGIDV